MTSQADNLDPAKFAEYAVERGYCTRAQIEECREAQRKLMELGLPESLPEILVKKRYLTAEQARAVERAVRGVNRIAGFELLEKVGQGGMGAVFRARQINMDRIVAIKILSPALARDRNYTERFIREARASAKLNHLNIIQGIDVGEDAGYYYFAMEFVDGPTCKEVLARIERYDVKEALEIGAQVASALDHAARHGMVHRDIKPDNIMIAPGGVAKLCDLGLAKNLEASLDAGLTQMGQAVGTPDYISPEQAQGRLDVDIRTDIYSLGATLYHMILGHPLFDGPTSAVIMAKHVTESARDPREERDLPEGTAELLARMTAKRPEDRHQTPTEVREDIEDILSGELPRHARSFRRESSVALTWRGPKGYRLDRRGAGTRPPSIRVSPKTGGPMQAVGGGVRRSKMGEASRLGAEGREETIHRGAQEGQERDKPGGGRRSGRRLAEEERGEPAARTRSTSIKRITGKLRAWIGQQTGIGGEDGERPPCADGTAESRPPAGEAAEAGARPDGGMPPGEVVGAGGDDGAAPARRRPVAGAGHPPPIRAGRTAQPPPVLSRMWLPVAAVLLLVAGMYAAYTAGSSSSAGPGGRRQDGGADTGAASVTPAPWDRPPEPGKVTAGGPAGGEGAAASLLARIEAEAAAKNYGAARELLAEYRRRYEGGPHARDNALRLQSLVFTLDGAAFDMAPMFLGKARPGPEDRVQLLYDMRDSGRFMPRECRAISGSRARAAGGAVAVSPGSGEGPCGIMFRVPPGRTASWGASFSPETGCAAAGLALFASAAGGPAAALVEALLTSDGRLVLRAGKEEKSARGEALVPGRLASASCECAADGTVIFRCGASSVSMKFPGAIPRGAVPGVIAYKGGFRVESAELDVFPDPAWRKWALAEQARVSKIEEAVRKGPAEAGREPVEVTVISEGPAYLLVNGRPVPIPAPQRPLEPVVIEEQLAAGDVLGLVSMAQGGGRDAGAAYLRVRRCSDGSCLATDDRWAVRSRSRSPMIYPHETDRAITSEWAPARTDTVSPSVKGRQAPDAAGSFVWGEGEAIVLKRTIDWSEFVRREPKTAK
ncbi:MAG: serine/threonine protein kinase [Planctomycetota bacterium]|nr:serine/threonine protein kinase [Planctomycetota bacterium]